MLRNLIVLLAACFSPLSARAAEIAHVFPTPSDDRWQYPFNFAPGFRATASCFGATGQDGFNDRDGVVLVAWETVDDVAPGRPDGCYNVRAVTVTLTNYATPSFRPAWAVDLTVDDWTTYVSAADSDPGRPVELFGVAFGPAHREDSWTEDAFYVGSASEGNAPRDPYPFVFRDGTHDVLHVEDSVKGLHNDSLEEPLCGAPDGACPFTPFPWAVGVPISYTPATQSVPFDVRFIVDLCRSDGHVRKYFQRQLRTGRVFVSITSMHEVEPFEPAFSFPNFFMKEGVPLDALAKAPSLRVVLETRPSADPDGDGILSLSDWSSLAQCLGGPGLSPAPPVPLTGEECLCLFDLDGDGDVDLADGSTFARDYDSYSCD